jgi:hypothetical protein
MDVFTYRPGEVVLTICGYVVEGWTNIAVTRNTPAFKMVRGIRGKNTRVGTFDSSATIKLTLTQTSITNDVLSRIAALDNVNGGGRLDVTLKDTAGGSLLVSPYTYLEGQADMTFSASQTERVWTILCDAAVLHVVAGNSEQGVDLTSVTSLLGI